MKARSFNSWSRILVTLALSVGMLFSLGANADEGRRIRNKVSPVYPELAKRVNAGAAIRLEIQIAPTGEVKSVRALGGHPLLIPAAEEVVRKWHYEPASETTTTIVEFRFSPGT